MLGMSSLFRSLLNRRVPSVLADRRSRRVVSFLRSGATPVAERELAAGLVAAEHDTSREAVSDEEVRAVHVGLVHATLPKLEDVDLLTWDREAGSVTPADHRVYGDPAFEPLLDGGAEWDPVVSTIANRRRAAVVMAFADRVKPVSRQELAAAVRDRDPWDGVADDQVLASLHHVHLPALDDAALVAYDAQAGTVTAGDHPLVDRLLAGVKSTPPRDRTSRTWEDRSSDESNDPISQAHDFG